MPGHNHYSWCDCGWCLKRGGLSARPKQRPQFRPAITFASVTIPNASCPVCGDSVFYYRNAVGSSVYFDDLGPPWPKHPCTDNQGTLRERRIPARRRRRTLEWRDTGWIPAIYERSKREDDWNVIYLKRLETGDLLRVLTDTLITPAKGDLVYLEPWDDKFQTKLEFLDPYFAPVRILGWKYDKWFLISMTKALSNRRKQA